MPTVPLRLVTADGVRLAAQYRPPPEHGRPDGDTSDGDDPDSRIGCVVAHGFTGSAGNPHVRRICDILNAQGFPVLVSDFRGHGRSGGRGTAGVDEVHDVAAGVAWLRDHGATSVVTLGWSMGGTAVLLHAGHGGDADAVVSVSAPGLWWERGTRPMRIVHWMFETRTGRLATRLARGTRISADGWDEEPPAPADVAGRIAPRPLLIVHGDADHYFPRRHVDALAAAAPAAEVWIEPGMGHAEVATTAELVHRIAVWSRTAAAPAAGRPWSARAAVCDDGRRD